MSFGSKSERRIPGRVWIYLLLFTMCVINYIDRVALSVAAVPVRDEFGLSPVQMGYMFSAFLWTYTLFLIPWGVVVDRIGTRKVAAIGITIWSLATVATGFVGSFVALLVARMVMGLGEATTFPAGGRAIREWVPANERGIVSVLFNGGAFAGPALGSVIMAGVVSVSDWRTGFVVVGSIGFVWLAAWLVYFKQPEQSALISEAERALIIAGRGAAAAPTAQSAGLGDGMRGVLRSRTLWALFVTHGCIIYAAYLFLSWMPSYLQMERKLSLLSSGNYTALLYAAALIGSLVMALASDRWLKGDIKSGRRRNMVVAAILLSSVVVALPWADSILLIMTLCTLSMIGIASAAGLNIALLNDLLPNTSNSGQATAFVAVGGNLFGLPAPIATGYVIQHTGSFAAAFVVAGCLLLIGAVVCLTLTRKPITPELAG
jgi:MFS family permease